MTAIYNLIPTLIEIPTTNFPVTSIGIAQNMQSETNLLPTFETSFTVWTVSEAMRLDRFHHFSALSPITLFKLPGYEFTKI